MGLPSRQFTCGSTSNLQLKNLKNPIVVELAYELLVPLLSGGDAEYSDAERKLDNFYFASVLLHEICVSLFSVLTRYFVAIQAVAVHYVHGISTDGI